MRPTFGRIPARRGAHGDYAADADGFFAWALLPWVPARRHVAERTLPYRWAKGRNVGTAIVKVRPVR